MKNSVYYFVFENEYMNDVINGLSAVFGISPEESSAMYKDDSEQVYLLEALDKGLACILANKSSHIYAVYIFAETCFKENIEEMLAELCDRIENDYGDDRRKLICSITFDSEVMGDCRNSARKFGYSNLLSRYL